MCLSAELLEGLSLFKMWEDPYNPFSFMAWILDEKLEFSTLECSFANVDLGEFSSYRDASILGKILGILDYGDFKYPRSIEWC